MESCIIHPVQISELSRASSSQSTFPRYPSVYIGFETGPRCGCWFRRRHWTGPPQAPSPTHTDRQRERNETRTHVLSSRCSPQTNILGHKTKTCAAHAHTDTKDTRLIVGYVIRHTLIRLPTSAKRFHDDHTNPLAPHVIYIYM